MKYRKCFFLFSMVAIGVLFLRSFPKIDVSTWSLLLMTTEETNFLKTWCRIQQSQLDVNKLLGTCRHCVGNIPRSPTCDRTPSQKTDIRYSYVSWKDIQPAGDFSRIFINTRNSSNQEKSNGGDYWRVFLNGPSFLSATVFDLGNGTYEAVFLPVVAGRYKLDVILVYTQCKGVIDPLRYSTDSGKIEYYVGIPESQTDPLLHRLQYHMNFCDCLGSQIFQYQRCHGCHEDCNFLWNGYGTWENENGSLKWRPYIKIDDRPRRVTHRKRALRKNGSLWFYGDTRSLVYHSVVRRPLCEKIFMNCENATAFYPQQDLTTLSADRISELVLSSLRSMLKYSLQHPQNALILNSGFMGHLKYESYSVLVDKIAKLLQDASNGSARAQIVWSTMMSLPTSPLTAGHSDSQGFLDGWQVHIYNAYANRKMCDANIPILDLFPLSYSHPFYTDFPNKKQTKPDFTFESVERLLEDFFEQTTDR